MSLRLPSALLLGSAFLFLAPGAAGAQQADAPPPQLADETGAGSANGGQVMEEGEEEEIVISGQRPRGSVVGDIQPEKTLNAGDVRATGASNINELLEALAPEIGSSRGRGGGGRPVLLLNGQRISGFRELRDIPTEAIQRVEILPEEVALKYGYRADQRVVNIVLRQRFRSTTALASATAATEGGYAGATGDVTRLMIQRNGRTQINLHAETNGLLTEAERDIDLSESATADDREFRSLVASRRQIRGNATLNRQVLGNVSATLNTELEHNEGRSLIGLGDILLEPLDRDTRSDSAHAGLTLNWDKARWRWNVTGNADWGRSVTGTDRDDLVFTRDRSLQTSTSADLIATANGTLFRLPAGNAGATFRAGASTIDLDSERRRAGKTTSNSLGRTSGAASVNLDLPVSRRNRDFSALGNLTFNANAEIDQLSDFGTLTTIGAGANWSPVNRLSLIASWTREEGAPTVQQLGDPIIETPGARVFDFTRGETALVTSITGGNPDLDADRRNVLKVGGNWQPFENLDLRFRADYVHQTIARPISSISVTPTIEAAFPERFVRAAPLPGETIGQLVSVDFRPVNFDSSRRDTLRLGLDFTKPLRSRRPSQAFINQMRAEFAGARGGRGQAPGTPSGPPPESGPPSGGGSQGERGFRGGGRGFGGGGFGGGNRGRIQFSLTDTITFVDRVTIAPGLPKVDYLHGDAASSLGGTPRHQVEAQGGWYNNGFGARVSANWRSGTRVESLTGDDLKFSPLATFDLRLFANLGEQFDLVAKNPWLRGTQVRLEANNIFDAKPRVHDSSGNVPFNYQPDLLNPIGRTVMISIRKLFLPPPSFFRRQQQEQQQRQEPTR